MNIYELIRAWFSWAFENPERNTPTHAALYFWILDKNNSMGWKSKFGLPTSEAMEAIGIKSFKTYSKVLKDLVDWGFVKMVQKSQNQHTCNIVALPSALVKNTEALAKASSKQVRGTYQSTDRGKDSIDIPITNYLIPNTKEKESLTLDENQNSKKTEPENSEGPEDLIHRAALAIANFFNLSEMNHPAHFAKIVHFVTHLHSQGKIDYLRKQLKGYIELKKETPVRYRHKWQTYLGYPEQGYANGAWNEKDWWGEHLATLKETKKEAKKEDDWPAHVSRTPYGALIAQQMKEIEADKAWFRENRPQA